jgi:hypothetical protein
MCSFVFPILRFCWQECPLVRRLECARVAINETSAQLLGVALQRNQSLQALVLGTGNSGNNLGSEGMSLIGAALRANHTLTELFVPTNKLSEDGALVLADIVRTNPCLTSLDSMSPAPTGVQLTPL